MAVGEDGVDLARAGAVEARQTERGRKAVPPRPKPAMTNSSVRTATSRSTLCSMISSQFINAFSAFGLTDWIMGQVWKWGISTFGKVTRG
jgi:hypothetical protein